MKIDISGELRFRTARSGGSGGQHVNKVESMVEGLWDVEASRLVDAEQKERLLQVLRHRINAAGCLVVRSQVDRTQLGNKQLVIAKMNQLVEQSLVKKKSRISTRPTAAALAARKESKIKIAEKKAGRRKYRADET